MLEQGRDDAEVEFEKPGGKVVRETCNAVQIINERGEYSATMGCVPVWLRPFAARIPWFSKRLASVRKLSGIALSRVNRRLEDGSDRDDLLTQIASSKDETGEPMGKAELTAEALTQVIAGSDTTSNTSTAVIYHVCTHPSVKAKLIAELDSQLNVSKSDPEDIPSNGDTQQLPYLEAVLNESLRYHSTSSLGLPRLLPEGGATVCGRYFPGGTVLSVPAYTIHRDPSVWGSDAESYNPDRWLQADAAQRAEFEKSFVPFSVGPRACVGRNVAMMELRMLIATVFLKFDVELLHPERELHTIEGFLRKPTTLPVRLACRAASA